MSISRELRLDWIHSQAHHGDWIIQESVFRESAFIVLFSSRYWSPTCTYTCSAWLPWHSVPLWHFQERFVLGPFDWQLLNQDCYEGFMTWTFCIQCLLPFLNSNSSTNFVIFLLWEIMLFCNNKPAYELYLHGKCVIRI